MFGSHSLNGFEIVFLFPEWGSKHPLTPLPLPVWLWGRHMRLYGSAPQSLLTGSWLGLEGFNDLSCLFSTLLSRRWVTWTVVAYHWAISGPSLWLSSDRAGWKIELDWHVTAPHVRGTVLILFTSVAVFLALATIKQPTKGSTCFATFVQGFCEKYNYSLLSATTFCNVLQLNSWW